MASAFIFVATVLLATAASGADPTSCTPTCPAEPPDNAGLLVPDPVDCGRYYVCLQDGLPSDFPSECPEGEQFDSASGACAPSATCSLCVPKCTLYSCPAAAREIVSVADPNDCGKYYLCGVSDVPLHIDCPDETPFFDGVECVADESACCDPCLVYCSEALTQIPDPADCTSYYFCLDVGFPGPADRHRCEEGNFNATTSHCDPAASCVQVPRCAGAV